MWQPSGQPASTWRPSRTSSADDEERDRGAARALADAGHRLILTTGGTGLTPTDVTPAATRRVIDREVPGLAELMRAAGLASTPMAALSRGVVGARGATLIVNLPGSPKGATESLAALQPVLRHALEQLAGRRPLADRTSIPSPGHGGAATMRRTLEASIPLYPLIVVPVVAADRALLAARAAGTWPSCARAGRSTGRRSRCDRI